MCESLNLTLPCLAAQQEGGSSLAAQRRAVTDISTMLFSTTGCRFNDIHERPKNNNRAEDDIKKDKDLHPAGAQGPQQHTGEQWN